MYSIAYNGLIRVGLDLKKNFQSRKDLGQVYFTVIQIFKLSYSFYLPDMLEYLPNALACQMTMGLKYPVVAAVLGGVWAISRLVYAAGYSTGDPSKRLPGSAIAGILYLGLIAGTIVASVMMIMGF